MSTIKVEVEPEDVGLSSERLARIDRHFQRYIDDGRLPGWLITISRNGQLAHVSCAGQRDMAGGLPVEPDTIWRIYSMTKPITAVVALTLWEEGLFELKTPVAKFIPEFGATKVWRGGSTVRPLLDAQRDPMLLWHLFSHTSGLTYGFMNAHPVDELYRRAGFDMGEPQNADLATVCSTLAQLPLLFQPGAEWSYSMSIDVLGRVIEVATGQRLDEVVRTRLLEPLGMNDTTWSVGPQSAGRLAALYGAHPGTMKAVPLDAMGSAALREPSAHMGGGGMQSTAGDYHRFTQMLLRGGELDGVRVLSPRTIEYMASNHLPGNADLSAFGRPLFAETAFDGVGFGLGVSVVVDPLKAKVPSSTGEYGWGGAASTAFWIDPIEDVTVQFFTQLLPSSTHPIRTELKQLVRQAIID